MRILISGHICTQGDDLGNLIGSHKWNDWIFWFHPPKVKAGEQQHAFILKNHKGNT